MASQSSLQKEVADYLEGLSRFNVNPLWSVMQAAVPPQPKPKAVPHVWKYDQLRPQLLEAGRLILSEQAERRVLMLTNPALDGVYTSDTLYGGLQLINPGETAPAHRHLAFALRFIIEGSKGFTAVSGEKIIMEQGDVILTPSWKWHDHGHEGEGPMIWLDGLDLPLFQAFPVNFAQNYAESRYPSHDVASTPLKHPWKCVQESLDASEGPYAKYIYPFNKTALLARTLGAQAERIDAGRQSPLRQDSASYVFHAYMGQGYTQLGDETKLHWKANDTFVIPSWTPFTHCSTGSGPAYLFSFTDSPFLEALGLYRSA